MIRRAMLWALTALCLSLLPLGPAMADTPVPAKQMRQRSAMILPILRGQAAPADSFAPAFTADVPDATLRRITDDLRRRYSEPRSITILSRSGTGGATLKARYRRGEVLLRMALETDAPYRITGLRITGTLPPEKSLSSAVATLQKLPGVTALALTRLDDGKSLAALSPNRPLAAGSVFKLVILAEISRAVAAGEMTWDDRAAVGISPTSKRSAPVRELAEKMISVSDNEAADALASFAGRDRLEAMMARMGVADPARNRPFLTVIELFKLKSRIGSAIADRWPAADEQQRRQWLDNDIAALPLSAVEQRLFQDGRPIRVDSVEWFFTADDMVRMMDWFRRDGSDEARRILALNPGIGPTLAERYAYVGYKGGSEPGVIAMNLLLQDRKGRWYGLAALWNNRDAPVDEARFVDLVSRIAERISPGER